MWEGQSNEVRILHDIKTPLTLLINAIQTLSADEEVSRKYAAQLTLAERGADQVLCLVRGHNSLRFNLFSELDSCCSWNSSIYPNLQFNLEVEAKDVYLFGDPTQFRRVIDNLVTNSVEAEADKISVSMCVNRQEVSIFVTDNGKGIGWWQRWQVMKSGYSTKAGLHSGLGLDICKQIITQLFAGKFRIISTDQGVGIRITIPLD